MQAIRRTLRTFDEQSSEVRDLPLSESNFPAQLILVVQSVRRKRNPRNESTGRNSRGRESLGQTTMIDPKTYATDR